MTIMEPWCFGILVFWWELTWLTSVLGIHDDRVIQPG